MTDPTTRDPAASLARLLERHKEIMAIKDTIAYLSSYSVWDSLAGKFVLNDAPALLAEVESKGRTIQAICKEIADLKLQVLAAEQVAREAAGIIRAMLVRDAIDGECRCINHSRAAERQYEAGTCPHQQAKAFLAHHGARTGESG